MSFSDRNDYRIQQQVERTSKQSEVSRLEDECRESMQSSLRSAALTNQLSQKTAQELKSQTEQIERIRDDTEEMGHNLEQTEYLLSGMKSWWSSLVQLFVPPPAYPKESKNATSTSRQQVNVDSSINNNMPITKPTRSEEGLSGELSRGLGDLSVMLDEIKIRAQATGEELKYQNNQLDTIGSNVSRNSSKLAKQKKSLEEFMK